MDATKDWLDSNQIPFHDLHMRPAGDYRQDFVVKSEILDRILYEGNEIASSWTTGPVRRHVA
jgi:hypothetical protein